ncbi:MAG TPA: hypothetical protein VG166_06465 [Caulobacteraceae bacterium]|nr:hypothetical protein [Caulobacteraceae bacterium]
MPNYKLISTSYPSGYSLASKYAGVLILTTGSIGGTGLKLATAANVGNDGTIAADSKASNANNGITALAGAIIRNGSATENAAIEGYSGVFAQNAPVTVRNYGHIQGFGPGGDGVFIVAGGSVTNGAANDTTASIVGAVSGVTANALASVVNFGSIRTFSAAYPSNGLDGVDLAAGGSVVNGSADDTEALIFGQVAGVAAAKTALVLNYGQMSGGFGVYLADGGTVINGTAADTSAEIHGYGSELAAIRDYKGLATITNFGTIVDSSGWGVALVSGGTVTNGASGSTAASILGQSSGVAAGGAPRVINFGTIRGATVSGVEVDAGVVTNGSATDEAAAIYGKYSGVVVTSGAGTVTNFGEISAAAAASFATYGVYLRDGGKVTNGSIAHATAEIYGGVGPGVSVRIAAGAIINFGTIKSKSDEGVALFAGGTVTNGASASTTATIYGHSSGVLADGAATVNNFATIGGSVVDGVDFEAGGAVNNGSATDAAATIFGQAQAVDVRGGAGAVTNFGLITGGSYGVRLSAGGTVINFGAVEGHTGVFTTGPAATVVNGSTANRTALITGYSLGAYLHDGGTLQNFATITTTGSGSGSGAAVLGGSVANGSTADLTALIQGFYGVVAIGCVVTNFATIVGTTKASLYLNGGRVTNGSATITSALISGAAAGVEALKAATVTNFATIDGQTGPGVALGDGCVLVNGAAGDAAALAEGATGVAVTGTAATLQNFAAVYGSAGVAVDMTGAGDVLEVEAGCAFYGAVLGGGGTLDLDSGTGTISGFSHGDATLSGAIAPATFDNFATFEIAAPASFTLTGAGSLTAGRTLVDGGHLALAGTLASAGTLAVTRTLTGTGTLALTAGTAAFQPGTVLTVAKITQSGGVASFTAASLTVAHPWIQTAGSVTVGAGDKVVFTGTGNVFDGTLAGIGAVDFTAGSDTLAGTQLTATSIVVTGAAVTLSGALGLSHTVKVTSPSLRVAAAGATLSGAGTLELTNVATNALKGGALTNGARIRGAGLISVSGLTNSGTIDADFTNLLTLSVGTSTITNSGILESTASGGLTLASALANTGALVVNKGVLTASRAVTGTGTVRIGGGTADFAAAFSQNVAFTSTTGVLELAQSVSYTGHISGFSKTGTTSLDLVDIGFVSGTTKASYSGTTASALLTVTDGTHTAKIHLTGNYTASTWTLSSDGHGGTKVVDPTPSIQPLISAMAGLGGGAGATATAPPIRERAPFTVLVRSA